MKPARYLGRALDRAPRSPWFVLASFALFACCAALFFVLLAVTQ